ncbi:MAG TPA: VOC family protein [Candidatus Saccharimonadia bacterium]|nr:VOC family protein [Candidatus Saccharimonadia bacterium]
MLEPAGDTMTAQLLVNIDVDDLERAIAFYGAALGLRVNRRFGTSGAELLGAGTPIFVLAKPAGTPASSTSADVRRYERHWTPVHVDFVVPDIDAAVRRARAAGAVLEDRLATHAWGHIAHFADPFGHGFCLIELRGRGYDEIATD